MSCFLVLESVDIHTWVLFPFHAVRKSRVIVPNQSLLSPVVIGLASCFPSTWPLPNYLAQLHPGRLTWNLQITHLERIAIFQTSMIMFHVNLQGCSLVADFLNQLFSSINEQLAGWNIHLILMVFKPGKNVGFSSGRAVKLNQGEPWNLFFGWFCLHWEFCFFFTFWQASYANLRR